METQAIGAVAHADLSIWALFMQADFIVKSVMIALMSASVWSWSIIFDKFMNIRDVKEKIRKFEESFWSGGSLDKLYDKIGTTPQDPMSCVFVAAMREWKRTDIKSVGHGGTKGASLQQRLERAMHITLDRELDKLEYRVSFLASTGSVSPFVGLFGTVWGIMNSFHSIGMSQNTSLAVVAPGIAEALFATALGLVAAIPAVLAYNKISSSIDRLSRRLENFSGEFASILSRQIDTASLEYAGE